MNNTRTPAMLELDELDLRLAKELELNARQTNHLLAEKLATSDSTVKRRLQRLVDNRVITISTVTATVSLGFRTLLAIGLNISSGKENEVVEHLRQHRNIRRIIMTTGRYDILITVVLRNISEAVAFVDEDLCRIPYLLNAETLLPLKPVKTSWQYLNGNASQHQDPMPRERDLDELDRRLIREIELCPRERVMNLAKKIGMNRVLVGRRLQALLNDHMIRVVSIVEPSFFGLNVQVFIFVKVQPDKLKSVVDGLVTETRVRHVVVVIGQFNLFLNAVFENLEEMSDFLKNHLGSYPGVISYESLIQVGVAKRSYSLLA